MSAKRKDNTFLYIKVDARDISYNGATNEYYAEDGLVMDEDGVWVSPQRKAERQADSDVRFRGEEEPVFYSNAMRAVEKIKQERATPEQWVTLSTKESWMAIFPLGISWRRVSTRMTSNGSLPTP